MEKILQSTKDVEAHLRLMREIDCPAQSESEFCSLIWKKIDSRTPFQLFDLTPATAFISAVCFILYVIWAFESFVLAPKEEAVLKRTFSLRGIVLDAKGEVGFRRENRGAVPSFLLASRSSKPQPAEQSGRNNLESNADSFPGRLRSAKNEESNKFAGSRGLWRELGEGDVISTGPDSTAVIYFPGAGYVRVGEFSELSLLRSAKEFPEKKVSYELALESGTVYSKLSQLESGSVFRYGTPFGSAEVSGTDFAVSSNRSSGMRIDVLAGVVSAEALKRPEVLEKIEKGRRAWIHPSGEGTIDVSSIPPEELNELTNDFDRIFYGADIHADHRLSGGKRNFRIVSRKER